MARHDRPCRNFGEFGDHECLCHRCEIAKPEYTSLRACVRACVHGGEPYAPRAQIRTEMAAITVADRWHERDGHIHHPRSFEYHGAERKTRRDDKRGRTKEGNEGGGRDDRRLWRVGRHEKE